MMKQRALKASLLTALAIGAATVTAADAMTFGPRRCAPDAVAAGSVCLDKYEASVWRVPNSTTTNAFLVRRIRLGRATRADLIARGATRLGIGVAYAPCLNNGQNCADDIYAVSLPTEIPSTLITWFQALEACANSGKRLPASAEWQIGASGTPDAGPDNGTTDCNTLADEGTTSPTGSRSSCVSAAGAFDMVGNLAEWVADWAPAPTFCPGWGSFSDDQMCLAGAGTSSAFPAALIRGGQFFSGAMAGPLTIAGFPPFRVTNFVGFRCAR
jgi:hypothetical protein